MQYIRVESISRRESDGEQVIRAIFEITLQEYGRIIEERNEQAVAQANEERRRQRAEQIERENEIDRQREQQWYADNESRLTE